MSTTARSQMTDRLPPQDLDAERGVLGSVMQVAERLDDVSLILTPEMFYLEAHQIVYKAILAIRERGGGIDAMIVSSELEKGNRLEEVGGDKYLIQILESVPHSAHAKYYAGIVRDKWTSRRVIYSCGELLRVSYEDYLSTTELLEKVDEHTAGLLNQSASKGGALISEAALRAMTRWTSPEPEGITFGFRDLDELVNRFKPKQLILIAARPGMGKSAFAGGIITHVAKFQPVFFASLEMPSDEVIDRMAASRLGISLAELRVAANDDRQEQVNDAVCDIGNLPIVIDDSEEQSVASIAAQCRLMKRRGGLGLVVVDYLQLLTPVNSKDTREIQVSRIANGLRCLAKSLDVPVLALAQLNRDIDKRTEKTPRLSDLRESGALEQSAHIIIFLDRPHVGDPSRPAEEAILTIAKHRGGRTGRVDLEWKANSATFRNQQSETSFNVFDDVPHDLDIDFGP